MDDLAIVKIENRTDAAAIAHLGAQTFSETFGHLYKPEDLSLFLEGSHSIASYEKLIDDPEATLWAAKTNAGEYVGYSVVSACGLPVPNMPENSGELMRFYVYADYQGGGLGNQMLSLALDQMDKQFTHHFLSVYAENFGAQRLYARYGFEIIHQYHYMVGNHADPEYIMQRKR